ncbi:MAG: hypothetical protein GU347_03100 [Desulfurococcales archaeon]|jgi:DNA replication factor GINS|uniref:GINS subunit domain-containing protein n=1 Tax=Fervidicoccus fontis TaxID=683846 RepID=A0A7J3SJA1_9CREN|nr:hypothetical protein [Desulfurococcales archaeon]
MFEEMALLKEAFERSAVKVIITVENASIKLPNGGIANVKKGDEIEVPRWMANLLDEKGIAKRKWNEVQLQELSKIDYKTRTVKSPREVESLPSNFYWIWTEYLEHLEKVIKSTPDPNYIYERKRVSEFLNRIMSRRIAILIDAILTSGVEMPSLLSKVTPEELVLLEKFQGDFKEWKEILNI